jgi:hypothetical protein
VKVEVARSAASRKLDADSRRWTGSSIRVCPIRGEFVEAALVADE